ncbi:helix-turn-helix transcriptional regulator [bacterium]|nr:helix-turn-helix transcriptional regulator [bacterium]
MQYNNKKYFISALGNLIKIHREKLNKNIYQISAETSIPRSTWRDIELALRNDVNLTNFCKIAEGLDIPCHELLKELMEKLGEDFSFTGLKN